MTYIFIAHKNPKRLIYRPQVCPRVKYGLDSSQHFESSIKAPHICIPKERPPPDTPYSGNNAHCAPDRILALLMIADPSHNNLTPVSNTSCTLSANCYRAPVPPGHWHTHAQHECAYTTRCSLSLLCPLHFELLNS